MFGKLLAVVLTVLVGHVAGNLFHALNEDGVQKNLEDGKLRRGIGTMLREHDIRERNLVKKSNEYATKAELQELDARLSGEIDRVSHEVAAVRVMLDQFKYDTNERLEQVDNELGDIRTEADRQGAEITKLQKVPVNFYAYEYNRRHPDSNEVITISQLRSNAGNGFNTGTGKFKCPVSGLYHFSFGVYGGSIQRIGWGGPHQVGVKMMKGGQKVNMGSTTIYMYGKESEEWNNLSGSNSAVLQCNAGEEVWLASPEFAKQGSNRIDQINFSGFLIRENP